jgi:ribosomal protein S18 acetylase RimI-like enzyme
MQIKVEHGSCIGTIYHNGKALIMVIDNVEVDKDHRHQGIGTTLMQKAIETALNHDVDAIELLVNSDNEIAKGLYQKLGFQKTNKEHHRMILRNF